MHERVRFTEMLGLLPIRERVRQAVIALRGEEDVPASSFGPSSLRMLRPRVALPLWFGRPFIARKVLITNLFNHLQPPVELGWSVKRTRIEDFRGRDMTYDSHNGTDFSIPVGTRVLTAAPGEVVRVCSEFNRGGLKIFIDHGDGLMTCSAHVARSLVREGQRVERGQLIALSGYSGLDGFITFPWGVPHVHFNTWLNGEPVDPFARKGETSLWRAGALPAPPSAEALEFSPSRYSEAAVERAIESCKTASSRARLQGLQPLSRRAAHLIAEMNYYPTRFPSRPNVYKRTHPRVPRLDLPFSNDDFDGVVFVDEL